LRKRQYKTLANLIFEHKKLNKSLKKILIVMDDGPFHREKHEIDIMDITPDESLFFLSEAPSKYEGPSLCWYQLYIPHFLEEYVGVTVSVGF
jgi:hypothetical protein